MKGRLTNLTRGMDGEYQLTISTRDSAVLTAWDELRDTDIDASIKKWHKKRSLDANAYFHALCNEIAKVLRISDTECKRRLVLDYGTVDRDDDGRVAGAKLPASVDPTRYYEYCKPYATQQEGGREYICYVFYKQTRFYDSAEMARLIDGTIQEAKSLGIETLPPHEIEAMEKAWCA